MKKSKSWSLLLCVLLILVMIVPNSISAAENSNSAQIGSGTLYYNELDDGTAEISGYIGDETDITIPGKINGRKVTAIADYAFVYSSIKSIAFPSSVNSIGDYAFYGCLLLEKVDPISPSVKHIGDSAFSGCLSLFECDNVLADAEYIGDEAFYKCISLKKIWLDHDLKHLGENVFMNCTGIEQVLIGKLNEYYEDGDCNAIMDKKAKKIIFGCSTTVISENIKAIGDLAFAYNTKLKEIYIPKSVTDISELNPFADCCSLPGYAYEGADGNPVYVYSGLSKIVVDKENSVYDSRNDCNAIIRTEDNTLVSGCVTTIIPDSVTAIGRSAFHGCANDRFVIPSSVTRIDRAAFNSCEYMKEIELSNSVKEIGEYAFDDCPSLTDVYYYGSEAEWEEIKIHSGNTPLTNANIHFVQRQVDRLLGDADRDEEVTILDATRIQRWLAELCNIDGSEYIDTIISDSERKTIDADEDGDVTIMDATAIQRHIAELPTNQNIGKMIR